MPKYQPPQIVATYRVDELAKEAALAVKRL